MAAQSSSCTEFAVSKRVLDLTTAALNISNSSNPLVNGALELGQWLGRERLNRYELAEFLSKAKGLAFPNEIGQQFCEKVKESGLQNPLPHIFLSQSGSLGRMMVQDPWLCWIVSSSALLCQFHDSSTSISDVICIFITRCKAAKEDFRYEFDILQRPDMAQIRFVTDKIVSSVWLNVVNAGHGTITLPQELKAICPRGHVLPSPVLGLVMHQLHQGGPCMILQSRHFLANIALWLLLHHHGRLVVVVSGRIIFDQDHGHSDKEIELRVAQYCPEEGPCIEKDTTHRCQVLEDVGGEEKHFQSGTYEGPSQPYQAPGVRQALYDIPKLYPSSSRASKSSIQLLVKCTAQRVMQWLLQVPLFTPAAFSTFGFQVSGTHEVENQKLVISDALSRIPGIVNFKGADVKLSSVVYASVQDDHDDGDISMCSSAMSLKKFEPDLGEDRKIEEVLPCFPILQDFLQEVKASCLCPRCQSKDETIKTLLQPGCLRRVAFNDVMLLMAHGIADGFGCDDVSAVREVDSIIESIVALLHDFCMGKRVAWDTWFSTAACVYLGCPFK
ncbi:MAG: hypothetical protein M1821_007950 [Bathelium mastoideum]|nr:MAG: hypothetical protein M1821_007950 [Bathelium mastoideum]